MLFLFIQNNLSAQVPFVRPVEIDKSVQDIKVQVMIQDKQKLMWLGTNKGLYRYDGSDFKLYQTKMKSEEIFVTSLFCDEAGVIWVGLKNGNILQFENDSLKAFDIEEGMPKESITGITADNNGQIWFSTYGEGLYIWNKKHFYNINQDDGLSDNSVYCIVTDDKGRIWAGSDGGISQCTFINGKKHIQNFTTKEGLSDNIVKRLIWDKNGNLWFGTDSYGIGRLITATNKIEIPEAFTNWTKGSIESMLLMEREVWIGTNGSGLIDFEFSGDKRIRYFNKVDGIKYSSIQCLYRDDEGNIWIASKDQLLQSPGERIEFKKTIDGKPIANIHSILVDLKKRVWYSDDNGLHRLTFKLDGTEELKSFSIPGLQSPYKILNIYQDAFGYIWIGTFDQGVFRLDAETGNSIHINDNKGLTKQSVLSITGKQSALWLATLSGAVKIILGDDALNLKCAMQFEYFNSTNGLNNNFIYQVLPDRNNRVWFAQDGKGISMMDAYGFHVFGESDSVKAKTFFSITQDRNGGLWFASADQGLYRYKTDKDEKNGKFYCYNLANGLPSMHITGLCADNIGNVIVVCSEGVALFNLDAETFNWFKDADGITSVDADLNTTSLSQDGVIYIGAKDQIIEINTSLDRFRKIPFLTLERVTAMLEPIDFTKYAKIAANQNHLSFSFQGIWFSNPTEVNFQYKMEGLNRDWINTRDRTATFSDLKPGRYTFRLRCSRTNDFSRSAEVNYSFVVLSPMYLQWWFITFSILALISLIWIFLKIRDQRVNLVQRLEKEKLASQFETLKNQVNPHFLFNSFNTLANIIEDDKSKAIEYIEKLTDFFRQILVHREKDLITLEEELEIINDYVYLQQQRFEDSLLIKISISKEQAMHFYIPPLALQILVENAIKHNSLTKSKPLTIELYFENDFLIVKNNLQPKMNMEPSTGTGLQNITRRMQMLGFPAIEVEKTDTTFFVKLKLNESK
ncbi:MAG: two-component regulator propeller domain-containing protein [Bacteroidota bacterium]